MKEVVKIKKLKYTYPDGTTALKGIDLDIFEGESIGLIGPNGAGNYGDGYVGGEFGCHKR